MKGMAQQLYGLFLPLIVVMVTLAAGFIVRRFVFRRMRVWGQIGRSRTVETVIAAAGRSFILWWLILGIYLAIEVSVMPQHWVYLSEKVLLVLAIASVTFTAANIATGLIRTNVVRIGAAVPMTSLTDNLARVVIIAIGFMLILNALGVSIVPVLATLGVGGLAVALALQDTMANFFAGSYIIFSKQVKIGDYIKLESGVEGFISDINWRMTKIRQLSDNMVLVPNSKLTQAVIIDYSLPARELSFSVDLAVAYGSDLEKVERVTVEVAGDLMKNVPGGVPSFEPAVRFHTFGDSGIGLTVALKGKDFTDQFLLRHEFIKRLCARYTQEGIGIPYPTRSVIIEGERPIK